MNRRWLDVRAWMERYGGDEQSTLLVFAVVCGAAAAVGTVAFYAVIDLAYDLFFRWTTAAVPLLPRLFFRPLATAVAMTVAAAFWRWAGKGHDGLTVPDVQLAVVRRGGVVPFGPAIGRTLASAITIGGGGSAGSEGPVAVLGAALSSRIAGLFRFAEGRTRALVAAGAAAGISAAFNAPLAGAFFALEEILGTFRGDHFAPVVVASAVAAVISRAAFGNHPAFVLPEHYGYDHALEVMWAFPVLGVVCGIVAAWFVHVHFRLADVVARLRGWRGAGMWLPAAAGLSVGAGVALSNGVLVGTGHLSIPLVRFAGMAWWTLLALTAGKVLVTSVTLQAGGSGGVFTPSLFIGASLGTAVALVFQQLVPGFSSAPEAYALVGMGAMVAATTGAPITAALLVFEITGDYAIVMPLMVAVAISQLIARRLSPDDLYSGWLRRHGEHLTHGRDRDVLEHLTVRAVCSTDATVLPEDAPITAAATLYAHGAPALVPVVDHEQRLVGVLTAAEIGALAGSPRAVDALVLAGDLAVPTDTVGPDDSLETAVARMGVRGVGALPVVEPTTGRVIGLIDRSHLLAAYEQAVRRT